MKKLKFLFVMLAVMVALAPPAAAQASGGFSIRAVLPDNQVDKKQTYFDLMMDAGERQTVEIVITNSRKEPLNAVIALGPATTGRNGLILYGVGEASSAQHDIRTYATLRQQAVTVAAEDTARVQIDLAMTDAPLEGVVLGGITVSEAVGDSQEQTNGVSIRNAISYVIALKLAQTEVRPEADFRLMSVEAALTNYRPTVVAKLENPVPRIIKDMKVDAAVYAQNGVSPVRTLALESCDMAPSSTGDFVIDWNGEPLKRGSYRLHMTATYEGRIWEWDEAFEIGGEANEINSGAVGLKHDYTWLYITGGLLVLALVWFTAYSRGKRERRAG